MEDLPPEFYDELKSLARRVHQRGESIEPTELLHEAWSKLARSDGAYTDRSAFYVVMARAMRQILIDRARRRATEKHGAGLVKTTLTGLGTQPTTVDVLVVDDVLQKLEKADPRTAEIVVLRVFGGLSLPEVADAMHVSESTASRAWRAGRAFLLQALDP